MGKITRAIVKALMPTPEKLSREAAKKIQGAFNGTAEEKRKVVAKWATTAEDLSAMVNRLAGMLEDGELDDDEAADLACFLEPVMIRMREAI